MKSLTQENLSSICFTLLFPGFFFYQYALGYEVITPFLGGYFGPVAVGSFVLLFLSRCSLTSPILINKANIFFFVILLLILGRAAIDYSSQNSLEENSFPTWLANGALFLSVCYLLARSLPISGWLNYTLVPVLVLMCFLEYFSFVSHGRFAFPDSPYVDYISTYQGTARSILVVGLTALVLSKSMGSRALVVMLATLALFFNGARSEIVFFVGSGLSFLLLRYKHRSVIFIIALCLVGFAIHFVDGAHSSRIIRFFDAPESSTSLEGRIFYSSIAWDSISNSLIAGAPGDYVKDHGVGGYAHNLLSAWVNLGILGMALHAAALLAIAYRLLSAPKLYRYSAQWALGFLFFTTTLIAFTFSKDHTYMLFGLAAGFSSRPFGGSSKKV